MAQCRHRPGLRRPAAGHRLRPRQRPVTGIDVDRRTVDAITRGQASIADVPSDVLAHDTVASAAHASAGSTNGAVTLQCPDADAGPLRPSNLQPATLHATTDFSVLAECDAVSICVPTPLNKTGDSDISSIVAATNPFSFMKFTPDPGLGGHCIPIDPLSLSWKLKTLDYNARFIELASEINTAMPRDWVQKVQDALNEAEIPILSGTSYTYRQFSLEHEHQMRPSLGYKLGAPFSDEVDNGRDNCIGSTEGTVD